MALSSFTGVFSRSFVIGFFAPSFFGSLLLLLLVDEGSLPRELREAERGTQLLILGGVALLAGLLLSGLNGPLQRLFQGYPVKNATHLPGRTLACLMTRRWLARYDELVAALAGPPSPARTRAAHELHTEYPARRDIVMPTRFGNVVRSADTYPRHRYGLDGVAIWPRIELLLDDDERQVLSDRDATVSFFMNGWIALVVAAPLIAADRCVHAGGVGAALWQGAVALAAGAVLAWCAYRCAVAAAFELGDTQRAAFDVRRLELYAKLGVRVPTSPADERLIGEAVNRCLLYAEPIRRRFRAAPPAPA